MASPNVYVGGIGGTTGATLAKAPRLIASGFVWYVQSTTGSDAAGDRGKERIRPLATLAQAVTNASAGDVIVCLANHAEVLSSSQSLNKAGLTILGEGSGSTRPRFTCNAAVTMFDVTAAGVMLDNIYFPASTTIAPSTRVGVAAVGFQMHNCYFECGTLDTVPSLNFASGAGQALVKDTQFVSTSGSVSSQPSIAIRVADAMSDLTLDGVTVDGGSSGWSDPYAIKGAAAITRLKATNLRLLNDSDVTLATGSTGFIAERDPTGSARVVWTA